MKHLKYFLEFLIISILFLIFRIVGYRFASNFGNLIGKLLGLNPFNQPAVEQVKISTKFLLT